MIIFFKNTALVSILTLLSRILGVIRDVLIALYLGTGPQTDAFLIAFRPFDLARKLFSEGIMNIAFIPVFSDTMEKQGIKGASALFFSCLFIFSIIGSFIVWTGIFFSPWLIGLIAPGFIPESEIYDLTLTLFHIMSPYAIFILISALFMGVLNTFGKFGIPASAPVLFNCVMIVSAVILIPLFNIPAMAIAIGVSLGGIIQLAIQLPFVLRTGLFARQKTTCDNSRQDNKLFCFGFIQPALTKIGLIMVPAMFGAATYQINIMLAASMASGLGQGSVSYIYFADRLVQLPLALFAGSLATVLLPEISGRIAQAKYLDQDQKESIGILFSKGIKLVFFITIPAMAGMMALNKPIVQMLFGHGAFSDEAVRETADCLFFLSTGLWAFTGMKVFSTFYFSLKKISIPFYSGLIVIVLNLIFAHLLMEWIGLRGLILSVSLSGTAGFAFLFIKIPEKINIQKKDIIVSICRSFGLSAIMFFIVRAMADNILPLINTDFGYNIMVLFLIFSGIFVYAGMNFIIKAKHEHN